MPEVRPIDANAIKKVQISMSARECCRKTANAVFLVMQHAVDEAPTLDYEPVVYAHWKFHSEFGQLRTHSCSNCKGLMTTHIEGPPMPYCPHCGAKMDEEG